MFGGLKKNHYICSINLINNLKNKNKMSKTSNHVKISCLLGWIKSIKKYNF